MSSPTLSDFTHRHAGNSGNANMWIIESIPKNDDIASEYGYSKKISHISMDKLQVQKMEFYNFDNDLFKIIETKDIQLFQNGKYMIKNMIASNQITGRKSEILFSNIDDKVSVEDSFFTVQNLER
ncbi:MAG: outer membrane lipoprotein-sorting protein, partial [Bacteroidales bacterium]|nr:outer membrane lipoprotein-sorting protein [Bacteroidales bacterium]